MSAPHISGSRAAADAANAASSSSSAAAAAASASSNPRNARPVDAHAAPQVFRLSANLSDLWNKFLSCFSAEIENGVDINEGIGASKEGLKGLKKECFRVFKQVKDVGASAFQQVKDVGVSFFESVQERLAQLAALALKVLEIGFKFKFEMPPIQFPAVEVGVSSAHGINIQPINSIPAAAAA